MRKVNNPTVAADFIKEPLVPLQRLKLLRAVCGPMIVVSPAEGPQVKLGGHGVEGALDLISF